MSIIEQLEVLCRSQHKVGTKNTYYDYAIRIQNTDYYMYVSEYESTFTISVGVSYDGAVFDDTCRRIDVIWAATNLLRLLRKHLNHQQKQIKKLLSEN